MYFSIFFFFFFNVFWWQFYTSVFGSSSVKLCSRIKLHTSVFNTRTTKHWSVKLSSENIKLANKPLRFFPVVIVDNVNNFSSILEIVYRSINCIFFFFFSWSYNSLKCRLLIFHRACKYFSSIIGIKKFPNSPIANDTTIKRMTKNAWSVNRSLIVTNSCLLTAYELIS